MSDKKNGKNMGAGHGKTIVRIMAMVLVLCMGVLGIAMIPGLWKGDTEEKPEVVSLHLRGDSVVVNNDNVLSLTQLREYLQSLKTSEGMPLMSVVCDSNNPPSEYFYNQVTDILREFGINLDNSHRENVDFSPETLDEAVSSFDETV